MRALPINRRRLWQLAFDAALIAAAWRLAYFLRFDKATPRYYQHLLSWRSDLRQGQMEIVMRGLIAARL